jgi:SNF2 family DNA or RNA helicase
MLFSPEPYQRVAQDFLLAHERAALFMSPGLGKTAVTLGALNHLFAEGEIERALVIAPLRVARLAWPNEVEKWDGFRWMRPAVLNGPAAKAPANSVLHVTNFENLHNLTTLAPYQVVVIDELTKAKNPASVRIKHLREMLKPLPEIRRWGLTGTPRPNSLLELHAQIRLLDDGKRLSPSYHHFRSTYFVPTDYNEYNWVPKPTSERRVYEKIQDLTLTLRASDYLDIPDTVVEDIEIALPKDAHAHYRLLERELVLLLKGSAVVARNAAILVGKLLQVCSGAVYDEEKKVVEIHHGKITVLKRLLAEAEMEKENVIIICNYIHERQRVVKALGSDAVDAAAFDGDIEREWNSGAIKYLVADPRSLGHGLNLQGGGRTVVWFSPNHSRELYDQTNARVARKGQTAVTRIYRLLCSGTMDDVVVETLRNRGDAQGEMLEILTNWQKMGRVFQ